MSFSDELDVDYEEEKIGWAEHSQVVKKSFKDGEQLGRENVLQLLKNEFEKNGSEDLKKIIDKIEGNEREKNAIILMRPAAYWIEGLEDLCKLLGPEAVIAEIGCYSGESTEVFARNLKMVFAIDPWKSADGMDSEDTHNYTHKLDVAERVFDNRRANFSNIFKLKGFDYEFIDIVPDKSLDAVYIDGNHYKEAVKKNIENWLPKVKDTGYICGHDYYDVTPGVVEAVDEAFGKPDYTFKDSSWAVIKAYHKKEGPIECPGA